MTLCRCGKPTTRDGNTKYVIGEGFLNNAHALVKAAVKAYYQEFVREHNIPVGPMIEVGFG